MSKNFNSLVVLCLCALLTFSCKKEKENPTPNSNEKNPGYESNGGNTELGKKLQNPYKVETMKMALANLSKSNTRLSDNSIDVRVTHLYVKFIPKTEEELSILKRDSTLILYNYPLDYEIKSKGNYYRDPSVPDGQPTYQYASVKVDKKLPTEVEYIILEELYIPEEDEDSQSNRRVDGVDAKDILVYEALKMTNNLTEEDANNSRADGTDGWFKQPSLWRPAGFIRVYDDRVGNWVGVSGAEVRCRRWFTTLIDDTDLNGFYMMNDHYRYGADYSIDWDRYHFSVRTGTFGQATLNGPSNTRSTWDANIGHWGSPFVNHDQQYYALIFQGAHDYYYGHRFGLSSPPQNGTWHPQVKISADISAGDKDSHAAMYARIGGVLPTLYVREWNERSDVVYAVTTHELAHAAHWDMDREAFRGLVFNLGIGLGGEFVIESWANGVEWMFAIDRYRNRFNRPDYFYDDRFPNYQTRPTVPNQDQEYTSIVVDMMDNFNQRFDHGWERANLPMDRVSGYSILQIEQGLRGAVSWVMWRRQMRERHWNETSGNIDELFNNWNP